MMLNPRYVLAATLVIVAHTVPLEAASLKTVTLAIQLTSLIESCVNPGPVCTATFTGTVKGQISGTVSGSYTTDWNVSVDSTPANVECAPTSGTATITVPKGSLALSFAGSECEIDGALSVARAALAVTGGTGKYLNAAGSGGISGSGSFYAGQLALFH
jgi:hypothetical protein